MRRLLSVSAVFLLGFLFLIPACGTFGIVVGSGDLTTQDYDLADFSRVEAENAFNIEVTRSAAFSVKVTVDDNLKDYLRISKEGDTLKLAVRPGYTFPNATFRAQVTMPALRQVSLSGASRATVSGFAARENLNLQASGASSVSLINMQVGTLTVDISGACSLSGEVSADGNANIKLSGASTVELNGRAQDLNIECSGASRARLSGFAVRSTRVNLSGASSASVNASGTLSGDISGASHLGYTGSPTLGDISTSGGSSVSKE